MILFPSLPSSILSLSLSLTRLQTPRQPLSHLHHRAAASSSSLLRPEVHEELQRLLHTSETGGNKAIDVSPHYSEMRRIARAASTSTT